MAGDALRPTVESRSRNLWKIVYNGYVHIRDVYLFLYTFTHTLFVRRYWIDKQIRENAVFEFYFHYLPTTNKRSTLHDDLRFICRFPRSFAFVMVLWGDGITSITEFTRP